MDGGANAEAYETQSGCHVCKCAARKDDSEEGLYNEFETYYNVLHVLVTTLPFL